MLKAIITTAAAAATALGLALAAPVTGGTVTYEVNGGTFAGSGTVGAGNDIVSGDARWDVDAGTNGDQLTYNTNGGGCGIWFCSGTTTMVFTLPLQSGVEILGASVVSSSFPNTSVSWMGNMLTLVWDEASHPGGIHKVIQLEYGQVQNPIPVPAAALLFAPAAFLAARRRKQAA